MMKLRVALVGLCGLLSSLQGSEISERARQLERSGEGLQARDLLAKAAQTPGADPTALLGYAEFLDRHGDPGCGDAYQRVLPVLGSDHQQIRASVALRLAELALLRGNAQEAGKYLAIYREASGSLAPPAWPPPQTQENQDFILIPGPLNAFSRMAALSTESKPEDVLPALARNVATNGYQAAHSNEGMEPTEYLKLVRRYLDQARELEQLAGPGKVIKIETCDSVQTGEVLKILGFRMRGGCGSGLVLETVNAQRAFITTDSGFPLPELEKDLRTVHPFVYDCHAARLPVLFGHDYWLTDYSKEGDVVDALISDPALSRLYLGMSRLDRRTGEEFRARIPLPHLKAYAHVLDFFGAMFELANGQAVVPGGPGSVAGWTDLVGAKPSQGAVFFEKLMAKDDGWLASYYDALCRINGPVRDYLTEPGRLKRFYLALRGRTTSPGPARPVFRSNAELMLLTARLWLDADGRPHIPGDLGVWRNFLPVHGLGKGEKAPRILAALNDPDDVLESLFSMARRSVDNEPLSAFMAVSDLDRDRPHPLSPATVGRLVRDYHTFGHQYATLNDAVALSEQSIISFLDAAAEVDRLKDQLLKCDAAGMLQALAGLWQIFSRQGSLPVERADAVFAKLVQPFAGLNNDRELFDAGHSGVELLVSEMGGSQGDGLQTRLLNLLAGTASPGDAETHSEVVKGMARILESQRVVALDDIFELARQFDRIATGEKPNPALLHRLEGRVGELSAAHASLSLAEKTALATGYWSDRHIEVERKTNFRAALDKPSEKSRDLRAQLTPFLRDTLVAYNYAYYAPPGAQILFTNPLFVRGHDFLGLQGLHRTWYSAEVFGTGWPSNGGGRLMGSLAGLPYALAQAEQNFLVPDQTQALIWGDLAPQMMLGAIIPRWWKVTPSQLQWVALHLRYGESLLADAAIMPEVRRAVAEILRAQAPPWQVSRIERLLETGEVREAADRLTPAELFVLAERMSMRKGSPSTPLLAEIRGLAAELPAETKDAAIETAFGTPKPTLTNSYRPQLRRLRTFPTLMGYSSRIMAESWESNPLYFAELADETFISPAQLNLRIPEWTARLVEHIFASHLEDWPALLRSLRAVGDDVRAKTRLVALEQKAALQETR